MLSETGPTNLYDVRLAYDGFRQQMVLRGGQLTDTLTGETWELDDTYTWVQRQAAIDISDQTACSDAPPLYCTARGQNRAAIARPGRRREPGLRR